ncbi:MAG: erythromycin biosynthesis sensory transduction protein eryC1, partial [Acidimicrobiia bacterium]|nr:erythromycin biosynthesis sensory transduction protein eryC1 [Acidimicrobiia bacterium]
LRVKLPHIDDANKGRRIAAERYASMLASVDGVVAPTPVLDHVFHQYTVRILGADRDSVRENMGGAGVNTMVYYPVPLHHLPVYSHIETALPVTEQACGEVLSLPMWPEIDEATQARVVDALVNALG